MDTAPPPAGNSTTEQRTEYFKFLWKWRKYLLLLAMLVASVTYAAGLNPPGGVRSDEEPALSAARQKRIGDPVLLATSPRRYAAFFYCNAAAFVTSLVVIMFLLDRRISGNRVGLAVLSSAMLLDLLALVAAFIAGSCRNVVASIYVSALFALVFAILCVYKDRRKAAVRTSVDKFLMLLSTFATPLTYGAGLSPPGGFWSQTEAGHRAGAPLLHDGPYKIRYNVFFYANANSFVASLAIIMLVMSRTASGSIIRSYLLSVCLLVELLGLPAAFAAGSSTRVDTTMYVVCLAAAALLMIVLQVAAMFLRTRMLMCNTSPGQPDANGIRANGQEEDGDEEDVIRVERTNNIENGQVGHMVESRSILLLLATLAATVTYQAGLSPPGGVWPHNNDQGHPDHIPGNPILLDIHPKRYKAFYYCNTAAFVASLVVIVIVQSNELSSGTTIRRVTLKTAIILGLYGLMGAQVAGSSPDAPTTIQWRSQLSGKAWQLPHLNLNQMY
ncbi:hypothetical protein CFC21_089764 [Triticum aestivum]|uniref:PGG domain-containing protein n=2 Tax=Triticum aestivum TaxID=4565 RepID=A0A3B6I0V9_WHEAT|nr:uncharacterized protein LOC123083026 [Triticum aestivum]KAF7086476.1 hypothetical protein CFC21_089764 [Triticum aestivum]